MQMIKPITKKELSKKYFVSYNTFNKWLTQIPELKLHHGQRMLTPKQIEIIYNSIGEPYK
jgi:hypothetical protein